jgi:hypothetical protein
LYSHKYLSLPLIPVEEFLAIHPEHADTDAHELMIARINHEHAEREKLEQARQELLKRKQALIAENKKRKDDLANLDQDLERFIDVSYIILPPIQRFVLLVLVFVDADDSVSLVRLPNRFRKFSRKNIESLHSKFCPKTICRFHWNKTL